MTKSIMLNRDVQSLIHKGAGKLCIINTAGEVVIEPEIHVDRLSYPSAGLCVVRRNGRYGYIDETGKVVIPLKYKKAYPFSNNGLAFVVRDNGLGGYINKEGRFVIHPIYETGSPFKFGFAAVSRNGEYSYIYSNGNRAIKTTFRYATGFADCGLAKIQTFDGAYSLMDTKSVEKLRLKIGGEMAPFNGGSTITKFRTNGRFALINEATEIFTGFAYDDVKISPDADLHPFLRDGLWGFIDNEGNEVIRNAYQEVSHFNEFGYATVKAYHPLAENNTVTLYINERDELIDNRIIEMIEQLLSQRFTKVSRFRNGLAIAVLKKEFVYNQSNYIAPEESPIDYGCDDGQINLFEVEVELNNMNVDEVYEFLIKEVVCDSVRVLDVEDEYAKLLWLIGPCEDIDSIEIPMYYALDDLALGRYYYTKIPM